MAEAKRRPWWIAHLIAGAAAGSTIVSALGPASRPHDALAAQVALAGPALPPGTISLDERLKSIEQGLRDNQSAIRALADDVTEVKRRLPSTP